MTTRFDEMEPETLRQFYWDWRRAEYLASQTRAARQMGVATRTVELIERVAAKRGVALTRA